MNKFKFYEDNKVKMVRSENVNYNFDKITGYTETWGKTRSDEVIYSDIGPHILDIEISTVCDGPKGVGRCHMCSPPGTKINTSDGFKNIEDIVVGDVVLGSVVFSKAYIMKSTVKELYTHNFDGELIKITTKSGNELLLTPDHMIFLKDGSQKPAGELLECDELIELSEFKKCKECDEVIINKSVHRYYCSTECYMKKRTKNCLICGREFHGKNHRMVFCESCVPTYDGISKHPLNNTFKTMLQRCYNPKRNKAEFYINRGIDVDPRWHDFMNFVADMGERPDGYTLDRIDNSKGYSKENCRWVDIFEQRMNRGKFQNTKRKYKGVAESGTLYSAILKYKNKEYKLGSFSTELEAAKAYNEKVKEFYPIDYERYWNKL